jgi:uncharacterized protein YcfL
MKKLILLLVSLVLLGGCAENTAGLRVDGKTQKVLFGDSTLGNRLLIDDITTLQTLESTRGIVTLTSDYKSDLRIQYRFYWYDDSGLEVNTKPAAWRQDVIRGLETRTISEVSIHPEGTQFRVQIREASN